VGDEQLALHVLLLQYGFCGLTASHCESSVQETHTPAAEQAGLFPLTSIQSESVAHFDWHSFLIQYGFEELQWPLFLQATQFPR
jgi:hypothetical protein